MAKITISIEGSSVGAVTVVDTLDQTNSDRLMSWLASAYGTDGEGQPREAGDMVAACWGAIRSGIFSNVVSHEAEQAAQAAREAVQPMSSETVVGRDLPA